MSKLKHYRTEAEAQAYIDGYQDGMSEAGYVLRKAEREFEEYAEPQIFMKEVE